MAQRTMRSRDDQTVHRMTSRVRSAPYPTAPMMHSSNRHAPAPATSRRGAPAQDRRFRHSTDLDLQPSDTQQFHSSYHTSAYSSRMVASAPAHSEFANSNNNNIYSRTSPLAIDVSDDMFKHLQAAITTVKTSPPSCTDIDNQSSDVLNGDNEASATTSNLHRLRALEERIQAQLRRPRVNEAERSAQNVKQGAVVYKRVSAFIRKLKQDVLADPWYNQS